VNQLLDIFSILALVFFIITAISNTKNGLLVGFLIKPLIDTSWDIQLLGVSVIDVFSIAFLFFSYQFIIQFKLYKYLNKYLITTWCLAHFGLVFGLIFYPGAAVDGIIRMVFLPVAFLLLPFLFRTANINKKLGLFLLIGALFSVSITVFQGMGIIPYETIRQSKGLARANGFYHDIVTSRVYVVQGLLALYFISKMKLLKIPKVWFIVLVFYILSGGVFLYSKALMGIILSGAILYLITLNRILPALTFGLVFLAAMFVFDDYFTSTSNKMFEEEIKYNSGIDNEQRLFSGRGMLWSNYLNKMNNSDPITFLTGFYKNDGRTHNEFLRIFMLSGLFGLIFYVLFFIKLISITIKQFKINHKFKFVSIWCLTILLIDASGVVWGLYPHYMLVIVGFYALSIAPFNKKKLSKISY